ncbi:hypothetical protein CXB51_006166 [Gossypium anomalum]|uniref:Uncharacterized protein n=1 Tax=Gossypium anomalum TaxID=47600 RepID=A0A8J5ZXD2_9ROSI|nr:hypothetical protein CXB51_006166 [Gossypium anomalum]
MHLQVKSGSFDHNNLVDMGTGILSGGLGVVAINVAKTIIQTAPDKNDLNLPFLATWWSNYTSLGPPILRAFPANAAAIVI